MDSKLKEKTIKYYLSFNYNIDIKILNLYIEFFGNIKLIHYEGLNMQYKLLKQKILNNKLIGLLLYGTTIDENDDKNTYVNIYIRPNGTSVRLTIKNISEHLINNYFNNQEINYECITYINSIKVTSL